MPVATAESFVDKKEKSQVNSRQRKKSTSVVVDSESTRQLAGNVHLDNQPSASYIPTHSPILNLSPNLSPESHPDSSSPVFELLDSNQRRTVQDLYGSLTHFTQDLVNMVNEEEAMNDVPPKKKRKMVKDEAVMEHQTSRPRSLRRHRNRDGYINQQRRHSVRTALGLLNSASPSDGTDANSLVHSNVHTTPSYQRISNNSRILSTTDQHVVRQPRPVVIDLSNSSSVETPRDVTPNQLQRMTTAVVGHPAYAAYGPSPTIALRGMPVVGHSMQATSYPGHSPHPSSLHTRADDLNTRYSQADGAVMAQQLHRTAPHLAPQALPSHRSHQSTNIPGPASTIPPAHQPRLYSGVPPHPYAHSHTPTSASDRRMHELQQRCSTYMSMNTNSVSPMVVPELPRSRMSGLNNVIHGTTLHPPAPVYHPYGRQVDQRHLIRHLPIHSANPQFASSPNYPSFLLHLWTMLGNQAPAAAYRMDPSEEMPDVENYEALLNLAERLGEAKPKGLSKSEIDRLVSYKYNPEVKRDSTKDQSSCVVCMCDFEKKQWLRVLPCSHEFHSKCVDKWLRSNRTCPICRSDALEKGVIQ